MGQKINPKIFRLGIFNNNWKLKYIENKIDESSSIFFKALQIKKYIQRILRFHGLRLHDYKIELANMSLRIKISYMVTQYSMLFVNKEKQKVVPSSKKKSLITYFLKLKSCIFFNITSSNFKTYCKKTNNDFNCIKKFKTLIKIPKKKQILFIDLTLKIKKKQIYAKKCILTALIKKYSLIIVPFFTKKITIDYLFILDYWVKTKKSLTKKIRQFIFNVKLFFIRIRRTKRAFFNILHKFVNYFINNCIKEGKFLVKKNTLVTKFFLLTKTNLKKLVESKIISNKKSRSKKNKVNRITSNKKLNSSLKKTTNNSFLKSRTVIFYNNSKKLVKSPLKITDSSKLFLPKTITFNSIKIIGKRKLFELLKKVIGKRKLFELLKKVIGKRKLCRNKINKTNSNRNLVLLLKRIISNKNLVTLIKKINSNRSLVKLLKKTTVNKKKLAKVLKKVVISQKKTVKKKTFGKKKQRNIIFLLKKTISKKKKLIILLKKRIIFSKKKLIILLKKTISKKKLIIILKKRIIFSKKKLHKNKINILSLSKEKLSALPLKVILDKINQKNKFYKLNTLKKVYTPCLFPRYYHFSYYKIFYKKARKKPIIYKVYKKKIEKKRKLYSSLKECLVKYSKTKHLISTYYYYYTKKQDYLKSFNSTNYGFTKHIVDNLRAITNKKAYSIILTFQHLDATSNVNFFLKNETLREIVKTKIFELNRYKKIEFFEDSLITVLTVLIKTCSAQFLANYIASKLHRLVKKHRFFLKFIKKIFELFITVNFSKIGGVKITLKGRTDKKSRKQTNRILVGNLGLQKLKSNVNNAKATSYTSDGTIGIEVWITYR